MEVTKPFNNEIIIVKNFLDKKTIDQIISVAESFDEEHWHANDDIASDDYKGKVAFLQVENSSDGDGINSDIIFKITADAEDILFSLYGNQYTRSDISIGHFAMVSRTTGSGMGDHYDAGDGQIKETKFGLVIYLNTCNQDFTGGELVYSKLGITYYPVAGDLVIHPGSEEYSHGVKDVTSGTRYMMSAFAKTT